MKSKEYLLCGPYLGDFKQEILTFRPYIQWVKHVLKHKKIFVNSHYNRRFFYNDVDLFVPIETSLTKAERNQRNYFHEKITKKEFNKILREFKEYIISIEGISKKECNVINVSYVQFLQPYSIYQKIFRPFDVPDDLENSIEKETIAFIPCDDEFENKNEEIYKQLSEKYNVVVIGDRKTHLWNENFIMKKDDYTENVYKYIISTLDQCKCVITPASHWTYLSNLQQTPVFSWGEAISIYKSTGDLNFGNNASLMYADKDTPTNKIINQFNWFVDRLGE